MPYITTDQNRYIWEHNCGKYHYGDMSVVRDCCIKDIEWHMEMCVQKATTKQHPNYKCFYDAWMELTEAERHIVGNLKYTLNDGFSRIEY